MKFEFILKVLLNFRSTLNGEKDKMSVNINKDPHFKTKFIWVSYTKKNLQDIKCGYLIS